MVPPPCRLALNIVAAGSQGIDGSMATARGESRSGCPLSQHLPRRLAPGPTAKLHAPRVDLRKNAQRPIGRSRTPRT
eukprot:4279655-Pyramimonas_sp.AAC.1